MKTLYELLEALPHDDAEDLRTAFRKAVKGAHPDLRPGDPNAALKFRQIVRANEILGDPEQRAAYDDLLDLARLEQEPASKHPVAARIHRLASAVIALSGASIVTVGGYLLLMHVSAASVASPNHANVGASQAMSVDRAIPGEPITPNAAMRSANAESVPSANIGGGPAISGSLNRDLSDRIAELDQALQPDPGLLPAYVDRNVIFYRTQKSSRFFPDVAPAIRIEKAGHSKSAPAAAKPPRVDQAFIAPLMKRSSRRRMAAEDPSRNEGFAAAMLR